MTKIYDKVTISPKKIFEELSKTVIGQEEAKKTMSELMFIHFLRIINHFEHNKPLDKKSNGLIMGPSGTGKTFIIREACKAMQTLTKAPIFNLLEIDCTSLAPRGWEGDHMVDHLADFDRKVKEDGGILDTSVVFLDEFDKLCKPAVSSKGSDHNKNVQYSLLKTIEGADLKLERTSRVINTRPLLFILAGNFSEVRENRKNAGKTIGFKDGVNEYNNFDTHQELENIGMVTQLVGRTTHIGEVHNLTAVDLKTILLNQVIPEYRELWKIANSSFRVSDDDVEDIVKTAIKRKTGARGLHSDFSRVMHDRLFNLEYKF